MASGLNSFFIAPDGKLIEEGDVTSTGVSTPTDLFGGNCIGGSENKGSLSAFVIGDPTTETSLDIRVNQSGNQAESTFVWKETSSAASWYGEPDRRWEWDRHDPSFEFNARATWTRINNPAGGQTPFDRENVIGFYCSKNNREYLFINKSTEIYYYYRSVSNVETDTWSTGVIPSSSFKTGTKIQGLFVCEHTDKKLKLVIVTDYDLDVYESEDGETWTLISEMCLSRFAHFRLSTNTTAAHAAIKIASSGPYLKIMFLAQDIVEMKNDEDMVLLSGTAVRDEWRYSASHLNYGDYFKHGFTQINERKIANREIRTTGRCLGSITSADGGGSWSLSDVPSKFGSNLMCDFDYGWDLIGLTDGSGKFVLMFMSQIENGIQSIPPEYNTTNQTTAWVDTEWEDIYIGALSSGVSPFIIYENLLASNMFGTGRPYLCCNNDWIWFVNASVISCTMEDWLTLNNENLDVNIRPFGSGSANFIDPQRPVSKDIFSQFTRENQMYFIHLQQDPSVVKWTTLGSHDVITSFYNEHHAAGHFVGTLNNIFFESVTTGAVGAMPIAMDRGNLYSCGPYVGWIKLPRDRSITQNQFIYNRFSGWLLRPPYDTSGEYNSWMNNSRPHIHQPEKVLTKPELNAQWGYPAPNINIPSTTTNTAYDKPSTMDSLWKTVKTIDSFISRCRPGTATSGGAINGNAFVFGFYSGASGGTQSYFLFGDPCVQDVEYWRLANTSTADNFGFYYDMKPPESIILYKEPFPDVVWVARPGGISSTPYHNNKFHGSCVCFTIGGIENGAYATHGTMGWSETVSNNDLGDFIGVKIRSYISGVRYLNPVVSSEGLYAMEVQVQFTSNSVRVYLPYSTDQEIIEIIPDTATHGTQCFTDYFWECRLSFSTHSEAVNYTKKTATNPAIQFSIRRIGQETWIDGISTGIGYYTSSTIWVKSKNVRTMWHRAYQFGAIGIFRHGSPNNQRCMVRDFRIVRNSDLGQWIQTQPTASADDKIDHIRGRSVYSRPVFLTDFQKIVWGGAAGYENDNYTYVTKSNFAATNTFKFSSPQIQYRTNAVTPSIRLQLPDASRVAGGNAFMHNGVGIFGINAETVSVSYADNEAMSGKYIAAEGTTLVETCRISETGHNNYIKVEFDGNTTADSNFSKYSSNKNHTYYAKFSALSALVCTAILNKSYIVDEQRGNHVVLRDIEFDLSLSPDFAANLVGTTIQIYSDTMVAIYSDDIGSNKTNPKYMDISFSDKLGTNSYFKVGSIVAGLSYGFQNVPLSWQHDTQVSSNITEYRSRSGIRWGYEEGPSVRQFSSVIMGDLFKQERENIKHIMQKATQFNNRPIVMVFDGDKYKTPTTGDTSSKLYVDVGNILYGTLDKNLSLTNPGWGYDETTGKWVAIGDMKISITEVV